MSISGSTWRKHPFEIGRTYTAAQTFFGVPDFEFIAGHAYELVHIGHSHYDGCSIFVFRESGGTQRIDWWWDDKEPESLCSLRFQIP